MMQVKVTVQLFAVTEYYSSTSSQNWGQTVIPAWKFSLSPTRLLNNECYQAILHSRQGACHKNNCSSQYQEAYVVVGSGCGFH